MTSKKKLKRKLQRAERAAWRYFEEWQGINDYIMDKWFEKFGRESDFPLDSPKSYENLIKALEEMYDT